MGPARFGFAGFTAWIDFAGFASAFASGACAEGRVVGFAALGLAGFAAGAGFVAAAGLAVAFASGVCIARSVDAEWATSFSSTLKSTSASRFK